MPDLTPKQMAVLKDLRCAPSLVGMSLVLKLLVRAGLEETAGRHHYRLTPAGLAKIEEGER